MDVRRLKILCQIVEKCDRKVTPRDTTMLNGFETAHLGEFLKEYLEKLC